MLRRSKQLREPREVEVHLDGDQLKASMKNPPLLRDMEGPKEPEVHKVERGTSFPAVPLDENHPRSTVAPAKDVGEFPPPRPPQVPNFCRQDPGPSMRRPDKHPWVHSESLSSRSRFYEEEIR